VANDIDWQRFNTAEHQAAQRTCHHLILCAVDGPTRKTVIEHLDYARRVGDSNDIIVRIAQLTGPCCLPPADPTDKEDQPCPPDNESPST
jgi:hypothetical protein